MVSKKAFAPSHRGEKKIDEISIGDEKGKIFSLARERMCKVQATICPAQQKRKKKAKQGVPYLTYRNVYERPKKGGKWLQKKNVQTRERGGLSGLKFRGTANTSLLKGGGILRGGVEGTAWVWKKGKIVKRLHSSAEKKGRNRNILGERKKTRSSELTREYITLGPRRRERVGL